jgi:putative OPT family oligopeptide transporter
MFSVPLRRTLVVDTDLPYPEGVAAAEVLRVGTDSRTGDAESRKGLGVLMVNGFASAAFFALSKTGLVVEEAAAYFRVGAGATGISINLSMAMIGAGHLIGISAGLAILTGIIRTFRRHRTCILESTIAGQCIEAGRGSPPCIP